MGNFLFLISILIKNRVKDYFFSSIVVSSLLFAILLTLSSKIFMGEKSKLFIDFGIAGISFITFFTAIFLSADTLTEIRKSKFYNWLLSLPLSKREIFLSSFIATALILLFVTSVYSFTFFIFSEITKIKLPELFFIYIGLLYLKFLLFLAVGLFFSVKYQFFQVTLIQLLLYFIGSSLLNFLQFIVAKSGEGVLYFVKFLCYLFPDFEIEYLTSKITHSRDVDLNIIFASYSYYITYTLIFLILGMLWIERRDTV